MNKKSLWLSLSLLIGSLGGRIHILSATFFSKDEASWDTKVFSLPPRSEST